MAFGLLGWVVLCLLGAGEFQDTWARWLHLAGLISRHYLEVFSSDSSCFLPSQAPWKLE